MVDRNECLTTGGGKKDTPCIFPFKFDGKTYRHCIWDEGEPEPWCSTKVTKQQNHVGGQNQWGYCNSYCPIPPKPGKDVNIFIGE